MIENHAVCCGICKNYSRFQEAMKQMKIHFAKAKLYERQHKFEDATVELEEALKHE